MFGEWLVGDLPVVEAEAAPETGYIVCGARVDEAGARERLGRQVRGAAPPWRQSSLSNDSIRL